MKSSAGREVARIVVIDAVGNVLLVRYEDETSMDPEGKSPLSYWVPPGGALEPLELNQDGRCKPGICLVNDSTIQTLKSPAGDGSKPN